MHCPFNYLCIWTVVRPKERTLLKPNKLKCTIISIAVHTYYMFDYICIHTILWLAINTIIYLLDQIPWNTEYCSDFVIPYTGSKNDMAQQYSMFALSWYLGKPFKKPYVIKAPNKLVLTQLFNVMGISVHLLYRVINCHGVNEGEELFQ